jgi:hypothetical protein
MVTRLHDHPITWTPPSPFWTDSNHAGMQQPTLLRFVSDDFMEELQRILANDPEKLRGYVAVPETWRGIRTPARTANPAGGRAGILSRLGVAARRTTSTKTTRPSGSSDAADMDLKLYQPAHQRYYLVGATLICQQPGLPDRKIDAGKQEKTSFVIRRWFPPSASTDDDLPASGPDSTWTEHAFIAQEDGKFAWVPVAAAGSAEADRAIVLPEEDRLPLFPLSFAEDDARARRLLAGLVPVGKRDAYHAAMRLQDDGGPGSGGPTENAALISLFRKQVSEPWKALVDRAVFAVRAKLIEDGDTPDFTTQRHEFRSAIQTASWLILADFRAFLAQYVPAVLTQIDAVTFTGTGTPSRGPLTAGSPAGNLYDALVATGRDLDDLNPRLHLGGTVAPRNVASAVACSLGHAVQLLEADTVAAMENCEMPYALTDASEGWPEFLFPLVDIEDTRLDPNHVAYAPTFARSPMPVTSITLTDTEKESIDSQTPPIVEPVDTDDELLIEAATDFKTQIDKLAALVIRALDFDEETTPQPAVPAVADRPADMRDGWFHIRCVYERPSCGALHDDVVSAPTERFKLAGFFDPDAPARPIRIGLPVDTTPAGLRKFDKNTAFVMSDILCGQVARMKGLTLGDLVRTVLPWPLHKDLSVPDNGPCKQGGGPNIGLICSLSIPIITICALILLMIMVSLLDFVFRWMPYFIVCFPLPGLRAKKSSG